MEALYVVEPGSYLRVEGTALRIEKSGRTIAEIPSSGLERLTLLGRCSMSGAVLDHLISNKVDTVFMTPTGRFRARLLLDAAGHVALRRLQYQRLSDDSVKLDTARHIVVQKISRQAEFLRKRGYRHRNEELRKVALQLDALARRVEASPDIDEVRGIEGYSARIYYSGFGMLIKSRNFSFNGRNRRPPRDPVNALLSFVYTLFTNEVMSAIQASGLDPYLGALHEPLHGRPSLACDLVEEWRVMADAFVLTLVNRQLVGPDDFVVNESRERPVSMTPAFMRTLIGAYERKMNRTVRLDGERMKLRWAVHRHVKRFVEYLENPAEGYKGLDVVE